MNLSFDTSIMQIYYGNMRNQGFWASEERRKKESNDNGTKLDSGSQNGGFFYERNPRDWQAEFRRLKELLDELKEITSLNFLRRGYFFDILV